MELIQSSAQLLSQVCIYTDKYDKLCVSFVKAVTEQILNFGKI